MPAKRLRTPCHARQVGNGSGHPAPWPDACFPGNPREAGFEDVKGLFRKIMA